MKKFVRHAVFATIALAGLTALAGSSPAPVKLPPGVKPSAQTQKMSPKPFQLQNGALPSAKVVGSPLSAGTLKVTSLEIERAAFCGRAGPGALLSFRGAFGAASNGHQVVFEIASSDPATNGKRVPMAVSVWQTDRIHFTVPDQNLLGTGTGRFVIVNALGGVVGGFTQMQLQFATPDKDGDGHRGIEWHGDDCDDCDANRFPGNAEFADPSHDEDCDLATYGCRDEDSDRFCDARACNVEANGTRHCGDDCNDAIDSVHPHQVEACNNRDDNCDGLVDEDLINCPTSQRPMRAP